MKEENERLKLQIDKTIEQMEHIRQYFGEDLQADFILLEEILKGSDRKNV